jgi:hypothetical protein
VPGFDDVQARANDPAGYVRVVGTFFSEHLSP